MFEDSASALKNKKRGRPSSSTPQANGKRSKRNGTHPEDTEPPLSAKAVTWKPPPGSWEDHIANLDACEDEDSNSLMVYLTWKNGQKTQHTTSVIYQRCPQKVCCIPYPPCGRSSPLHLDAAVLRAACEDHQARSRW